MRRYRLKYIYTVLIFTYLFGLMMFMSSIDPDPSDLVQNKADLPHRPNDAPPPHREAASFLEVLHQMAPLDKSIVLARVDCEALEIAENFYEASLRKHRINNVVFVTSDTGCDEKMAASRLPLHVYRRANNVVVINRDAYEISHTIAVALDAGYTVLHTDIDVVFFKNPFNHIDCANTYMAVMPDLDTLFLYVCPTPQSLHFFRYVRHVALTKTRRQTVSEIIRGAIAVKRELNVTWLPQDAFQNGRLYFEEARRAYNGDNPCSECVVLQNNGLRSLRAKIYRLKENMMWVRDAGDYYSSKTRKYLSYGNPLDGSVYETEKYEKSALENALSIGAVLNRTVILPQFYCAHERRHCGISSLYDINAFDAEFGGMYREHVFLGNEKVPDEILESQTRDFVVATMTEERVLKQTSQLLPPIRLVPNNRHQGATSEEIVQWFGDVDDSLLCFKSLYSAFDRFTDPSIDSEFKAKLERGLQATYHHKLRSNNRLPNKTP